MGPEDTDEIVFTGQRIRWKGNTLVVDQDKAIEELSEIQFDESLKNEVACNPTLRTEYRSLLGSLNWLQSTQFQIAFKFSRCVSAAASPTIGDVRAFNKVVRSVRSQPVRLHFWPMDRLRGLLARIVGYPDASYRNNSDGSSQRAQVIFLAEPRTTSKHTRRSLVDYESQKIKRTTLSTTVSELYSFMKCFGTCQFVRGLWKDISGEAAPIHLRTDASNLVTRASTTHLPEQKEIIHMIRMLRKESCSGEIDDLAHVRTEDCLSDSLTKQNIKADTLTKAVETGISNNIHTHPSCRDMLKHTCINGLPCMYRKQPLGNVSWAHHCTRLQEQPKLKILIDVMLCVNATEFVFEKIAFARYYCIMASLSAFARFLPSFVFAEPLEGSPGIKD